tara:strand:- start:717 stop:863 length:147 start_codon:yes stop_codon:yes gene_type:complete
MVKKAIGVLMQIVTVKLLKLILAIDQLFFAQNVKNNKVDPNYKAIYTI